MGRRKGAVPRWLRAARQQGVSWRPGEQRDWLARALARAGVLPLAEADRAVREGRVGVDGEPVREPFAPVPAPGAAVTLDGQPVSLVAPLHLVMFHKPAGLIVAGHDPEGVGTVFEALRRVLPPALQGHEWYAIGRLDRDTTGLLLFTSDERVISRVASPRAQLPKRYRARVAGTPSDAALQRLREGLVLWDGPTLPARARLLADGEVELVLTEGRHHQVKRMLAAVGHPVQALHREAVGGLVLDVPPGGWRLLTPGEREVGLGLVGPPGP
jgi:23S rRNA pseudouridine2605 synthase/16S rRNA pseudouridine516 synthase